MEEFSIAFTVTVSGAPNGFSALLGANEEPLPITVELNILGQGSFFLSSFFFFLYASLVSSMFCLFVRFSRFLFFSSSFLLIRSCVLCAFFSPHPSVCVFCALGVEILNGLQGSPLKPKSLHVLPPYCRDVVLVVVRGSWRYESQAVFGSSRTVHDPKVLYSFPFEANQPRMCGQSVGGEFSHNDALSYHAVDFMMPVGTPVLAARGGTVLRVKASESQGGPNPSFRQSANYVWIAHSDGSVAGYAHLAHQGVVVQPGAVVQEGQHIGYSGNTGFSQGPHLHFAVMMPAGKPGGFPTIPFAFRDPSSAAPCVPCVNEWYPGGGSMEVSAEDAVPARAPPGGPLKVGGAAGPKKVAGSGKVPKQAAKKVPAGPGGGIPGAAPQQGAGPKKVAKNPKVLKKVPGGPKRSDTMALIPAKNQMPPGAAAMRAGNLPPEPPRSHAGHVVPPPEPPRSHAGQLPPEPPRSHLAGTNAPPEPPRSHRPGPPPPAGFQPQEAPPLQRAQSTGLPPPPPRSHAGGSIPPQASAPPPSHHNPSPPHHHAPHQQQQQPPHPFYGGAPQEEEEEEGYGYYEEGGYYEEEEEGYYYDEQQQHGYPPPPPGTASSMVPGTRSAPPAAALHPEMWPENQPAAHSQVVGTTPTGAPVVASMQPGYQRETTTVGEVKRAVDIKRHNPFKKASKSMRLGKPSGKDLLRGMTK